MNLSSYFASYIFEISIIQKINNFLLCLLHALKKYLKF